MAALRDMQWRRRRFVIAILSTAIIFAMTLVLTGLANGFRVEAERPSIRSASTCSSSRTARPARSSGRRRSRRWNCAGSPAPRRAGGGSARIRRRHGHAGRLDAQCRPVRRAGERARHARRVGGPPTVRRPTRSRCRARSDAMIGDDIEIASRKLRIVGIVENSTALANLPNIFLTTAGRTAARVRRAAAGRVDRHPRHARSGARRLPGHRPRRRGRRSAAAAESGGQLDHDRRDPAVGRRGTGRRIGDLSVRARTTARLRGVQGDWRPHRATSPPGSRCRRSSSRCSPRLSAPCFRRLLGPMFPMQVIVPS